MRSAFYINHIRFTSASHISFATKNRRYMRLDIRYYTANHIADVRIYQYVFCRKNINRWRQFSVKKAKAK